VDYGLEMESASASTTGPGATAGVPSAIESASSGLVKPAAASEQHDENADNLVVLVAAALPMVDGLAMDDIDRSTVDASTCTEAEKSQEEASSSQIHDESNNGVAVADTDARHGHAAEDVVDGETAENDTFNDNDEDEEGNHDYDGMEELTEEEEKSAMLNIVLSELLRKFREENGRGPNSEEVLEIRASIAEQLEMEVATSESIEHHNATAAAAAAATSNQPADPQQQQERDDRKRPAETNCSEKDDDDNNSSSNQPAPKRVKFHSSVASPSQPEDSIAPEPLPNELPETPP
jgi:hypothetical protein